MLCRPTVRRLLLAAVVVAALTLCYFFLDRPVARAFERIPAGWNPLFHGVSALVGFPLMPAVGLAMLVFFFVRTRSRPRGSQLPLVYLPVAALTASATAELLKIILARYRPGLLIDAGLYGFTFWKAGYWFNSFPSGHAAIAFAFFGALALVLPRWRVRALLLAGLIAASRVLLNLHYLSDIIAGALVGLGWAYAWRRLLLRLGMPPPLDT